MKRRGRLVVLRGNSGSGKTTTARELRRRDPGRFVWIEQDNIRRTIIDEDGLARRPFTVDMIDRWARLALAGGRDVIVEGILDAARYGSMLHGLYAEHPSVFYYFALAFDETVRGHVTRSLAGAFGEREMAGWYRAGDRLNAVPEVVIGAEQRLRETARPPYPRRSEQPALTDTGAQSTSRCWYCWDGAAKVSSTPLVQGLVAH